RMQNAYHDACKTDVTGILLECYHDAQETRQEAEQMARLGFLSLEHLAHAEAMYWSTCREVLRKLLAAELSPAPTEQLELEEQLTAMSRCGVSDRHSILDHRASQQVFPVMRLHRLTEKPGRRGRVVDLPCASDGTSSQYVVSHGNTSWLPLQGHKH